MMAASKTAKSRKNSAKATAARTKKPLKDLPSVKASKVLGGQNYL
jgi:hypothetical protein